MANIAETIRSQIMALDWWALARWGAHKYGFIPAKKTTHRGGLHFTTSKCKFHPQNVSGKVIITLNRLDLYDIELGYVARRTYEWVSVKKYTDIYNDQLVDILSRELE